MSLAISERVETHDAHYARGIGLVLIAGGFWSIAGLVVRMMHHATEWQILFYRSVALVITLLVYLAVRNRGNLLGAFKQAGGYAILAGAFLSISFTWWIFAMTHTTIANALFVLSAAPFLAAVFARFLLGEEVRPSTWLFMFLASLGVAVMVVEGIAGGTLAGNLYALGAATGFAAFSVTLRKGKAVDMTPAVCWAGVWATLIGASMLFGTHDGFALSMHDVLLCGLLGFVQVGLGLILFTAGSRYVPAAEITLLSLTEVVLGPIWVWLGVGEKPSPLTLLGGAVVLSAIIAQAIHGVRRKRPPVGVV
jgi:drug/metabolite transporter (DMT)-like permease